MQSRNPAVPDRGSREYTINAHRLRTKRIRRAALLSGPSSVSGNRMCLPGRFSSAATAQARPPFGVGGLTCNTHDPRVGLVLGSRQDMRCVFSHLCERNGPTIVYRGTIRRIGVDIGVTRGGTLLNPSNSQVAKFPGNRARLTANTRRKHQQHRNRNPARKAPKQIGSKTSSHLRNQVAAKAVSPQVTNVVPARVIELNWRLSKQNGGETSTGKFWASSISRRRTN